METSWLLASGLEFQPADYDLLITQISFLIQTAKISQAQVNPNASFLAKIWIFHKINFFADKIIINFIFNLVTGIPFILR